MRRDRGTQRTKKRNAAETKNPQERRNHFRFVLVRATYQNSKKRNLFSSSFLVCLLLVCPLALARPRSTSSNRNQRTPTEPRRTTRTRRETRSRVCGDDRIGHSKWNPHPSFLQRTKQRSSPPVQVSRPNPNGTPTLCTRSSSNSFAPVEVEKRHDRHLRRQSSEICIIGGCSPHTRRLVQPHHFWGVPCTAKHSTTS